MLKALRLARDSGAKTALDIDYRPNLWGLSGHGDGENRFIASKKLLRSNCKQTLSLFDLIVGTEEEFHIAGGTTDHARCPQGSAQSKRSDHSRVQTRTDGRNGLRRCHTQIAR